MELAYRPQVVAKLDLDRGDPDLIQIDPDSFTQKLLQTIRRNPLISRKLLAVELNASERKIRESLKNLKDSGFIIRQGPDHGGIWRVSRIVKTVTEAPAPNSKHPQQSTPNSQPPTVGPQQSIPLTVRGAPGAERLSEG